MSQPQRLCLSRYQHSSYRYARKIFVRHDVEPSHRQQVQTALPPLRRSSRRLYTQNSHKFSHKAQVIWLHLNRCRGSLLRGGGAAPNRLLSHRRQSKTQLKAHAPFNYCTSSSACLID